MKRLEEIPKERVFRVPEGYFERLPMRISARIEAGKPSWVPEKRWSFALRVALPVILVAAVAFLLYQIGPSSQPDEILSSVSTEALYEFLEESELSTDELLSTLDIESFDLEALEEQAYPPIDLNEEELDQLELDFEQDNSQP